MNNLILVIVLQRYFILELLYSILKIRTDYGKFNIRFVEARICSWPNESRKKFRVPIEIGREKEYNSTTYKS